MGSVLRLRVNGKERELPYSGAGATVLDLLSSLDLHPRTVAVELNRELVPRAGFGEASLGDGDRIEIVRFVQGGSPPAECAAETGVRRQEMHGARRSLAPCLSVGRPASGAKRRPPGVLPR